MDAPVSPQESIAGMREVIAQSGPERSGTPWDVRGIRLPRCEVDPFQWTVYVLGFMQLLDSASRSPWVSNSPVLGDDGAGYTILR